MWVVNILFGWCTCLSLKIFSRSRALKCIASFVVMSFYFCLNHILKCLILPFFLLTLGKGVNGQKCFPKEKNDQIVCTGLASLHELSKEMSPDWVNIVILNQPGNTFTISGENWYITQRQTTNHFISITEHESHHLNIIQKLDLSQAGRFLISDHGFKDLSSLQFLNISGANIPTLKVSYFLPHATVTNLDVSWNKIGILTRNMLESLTNLQYANFSHNNLQTIQPNTFDALTQLKYLNLDDNQLKVIDYGEIKRLQYLSLSDNLIDVVSVTLNNFII